MVKSGDYLYWKSEGAIWRSLAAGNATPEAVYSPVSPVSWMTFRTTNDRLIVADAVGGEARLVVMNLDGSDADLRSLAPANSMSGLSVIGDSAYSITGSTQFAVRDVTLMPLASGEPTSSIGEGHEFHTSVENNSDSVFLVMESDGLVESVHLPTNQRLNVFVEIGADILDVTTTDRSLIIVYNLSQDHMRIVEAPLIPGLARELITISDLSQPKARAIVVGDFVYWTQTPFAEVGPGSIWRFQLGTQAD